MKLIRTEDAVGHVLCHDMTRIVKGETKGPAFRKGHVVTAQDIPMLLSMGKENLYVWEVEPGMLHENEAAELLYALCAGPNMCRSEVKEGKIEVIAECDGLLLVDVERLKKVNSLGELMIATRHSRFPVKKGDKLAGTRIIPLLIHEDKLAAARGAAGERPLLELRPFRSKKVGIVTTGSEIQKGLIQDTFTPVLVEKVGEYGCEILGQICPGDDHTAITAAILELRRQGADLVLCSGGMSVDPDDKTPLGIKNTGARVVSYGAPVLPGAMLMLAYLDGEIPVVGLPGCVMYAKRTVFDLVLPSLIADAPITADDLAAMGHGGLCLNCDVCTYPNCGFGKGW
ncbi:Molybdopterin binding domain protein [uncultured Eubacteriales bacterium]|uniref:Molybdopterin molybdenumtransferase n=1 Tax=uncultured Eubacteriales bacterium TaxID=172733 RepID=A0A212JZZ5_9FIRM|nr:Molybdopterin binding domain protein [uncultured Eubacteriales bacterium]